MEPADEGGHGFAVIDSFTEAPLCIHTRLRELWSRGVLIRAMSPPSASVNCRLKGRVAGFVCCLTLVVNWSDFIDPIGSDRRCELKFEVENLPANPS